MATRLMRFVRGRGQLSVAARTALVRSTSLYACPLQPQVNYTAMGFKSGAKKHITPHVELHGQYTFLGSKQIASLLKEIRSFKDTSNYSSALKALRKLDNAAACQRSHLFIQVAHLVDLYNPDAESRNEQIYEIYKRFERAETTGLLQPSGSSPDAKVHLSDMQSAYISMNKLRLLHKTLYSLISSSPLNHGKAAKLYQRNVAGRFHPAYVIEYDYLNFLLLNECLLDLPYHAWNDGAESMRSRIDCILGQMEKRKFYTSYASFHAFIRLIFTHPDWFDGSVKQIAHNPSSTNTLTPLIPQKVLYQDSDQDEEKIGDILVSYLNKYSSKALRKDSKRMVICISTAASFGLFNVAKRMLEMALEHGVSVHAGAFAHAMSAAESSGDREVVNELYRKAIETDNVHLIQNQPRSIMNYLLLYTTLDGNFRHMIELLHEMNVSNNQVNNRTVKQLFRMVAQYRREEEEKGVIPDACPSIPELLSDYSQAIHARPFVAREAVLNCVSIGDIQSAMKVLRSYASNREVKVDTDVYSQVMFAIMVEKGVDKYDEVEISEIERMFQKDHDLPTSRLYTQLVQLSSAVQDLRILVAWLDRWEERARQHPVSKRALQKVLDLISNVVRSGGEDQKMRSGLLPFLKRYPMIIPLDDPYNMSQAMIRAVTLGHRDDVLALIRMSVKNRVSGLHGNAVERVLNDLLAEDRETEAAAFIDMLQQQGEWEGLCEKRNLKEISNWMNR